MPPKPWKSAPGPARPRRRSTTGLGRVEGAGQAGGAAPAGPTPDGPEEALPTTWPIPVFKKKKKSLYSFSYPYCSSWLISCRFLHCIHYMYHSESLRPHVSLITTQTLTHVVTHKISLHMQFLLAYFLNCCTLSRTLIIILQSIEIPCMNDVFLFDHTRLGQSRLYFLGLESRWMRVKPPKLQNPQKINDMTPPSQLAEALVTDFRHILNLLWSKLTSKSLGAGYF